MHKTWTAFPAAHGKIIFQAGRPHRLQRVVAKRSGHAGFLSWTSQNYPGFGAFATAEEWLVLVTSSAAVVNPIRFSVMQDWRCHLASSEAFLEAGI